MTISVPIQIKRRSGRKLVTLPTVETTKARPWNTATTPLQLALARGHRWLAMLESGESKSLKEIAVREGIDNSCVGRMVNLTTLAPAILVGTWMTPCRTTSRCLTWRLTRLRCGTTSALGSGRPLGPSTIKFRRVPTILAHE